MSDPYTAVLGVTLLILLLVLVVGVKRAGRGVATLREALAQANLRAERAANLASEESTARELLTSALHSSEGRTRAILEAAVDGIITIDERGRIQSFNRAAERIFGYGAAEVTGLNVRILMPEPYHSAHDGYLRNYNTTGQARIIGIGREVVGLRKDGSTFAMDLAVGASVLEGQRIFAGIIRDITERKRAERQLFESEEKFRLLVEGVRNYAISLMDGEGMVTSWNRGAEEIYGWSPEEAAALPFSSFFTAADQAAGEPERILSIVRREARFDGEGLRLRKDGTTHWAYETLTRLSDGKSGSTAFVRIVRDMTAQREQEAALRSAKEEADRANLAKSKFLASASHDLRQPVQALTFFTSALGMKLKDGPGAAMLEDISQSLDGLNTLLDSLLDVSKLDAGIVTPQVKDFAVADIFERVLAEFTPAARAKGLALRWVRSGEFVHTDPTLLGRILRNLVSNAIRYTEHGKVLVGLRRRSGGLWLEVWDTGIGIPVERREDIFDEFIQLANPERDRSHGLGLGLAIVRRLCRLLGHRLELRSVPGKGSGFLVELPRGRKMPSLASTSIHVPKDNSRRLVLIIDDEASVLKGLGLILEEWGFAVLAAGSEDEAIAKLLERQVRPHAILADYRLRDGHTGAEAVRHIRSLFDSAIPSIIITGDTAPERLREAEASGFSILHKPVQPPHLHTLLVNVIASALH